MTTIQKSDSIEYMVVKYIPHLLIGILILMNLIPVLAPILAYLGLEKIADIIYYIYSFSCHQKAHRSLHFFDHQSAWCVRDTFIWLTLLVVASFVFLTNHKATGLSLKLTFIIGLPMALDGGIQLLSTVISMKTGTSPFYESTNTIRAITGMLFGLAVAMYLFPRMKKELETPSKIEVES